MKAIVVYYSRYGSTRQYAEWIGAAIGAEVVELKQAKGLDLAAYDAVVFGCPFYAGRLKIAGLVQEWAPRLVGRRLAFFAVTARPPGDRRIVTDFERAVPEDVRRNIRFFALPGRLVLSKMSLLERAVMKLMKAADFDRVRQDEITPLVEYLRGGTE